MSQLFEELKKRKVVRAAITYAAVAFAVLQASDLILTGLGAPPTMFRVITALVLVGFPIVLGLAWAFDITAAGVQRAPRSRRSAVTGVGLVVLGLLTAVVAFAAFGGFRRNGGSDRRIDSIGVLPFVSMSGDPNNEYFSDGMTEELLNLLARIEGLQVASRTSSFQFKGRSVDVMEAARALGVGAILEGSVRQSGNQLRITAQLIDASNGYHLWSETYDRTLDDVFALQDEIARTIAEKLKVELGVAPQLTGRTANIDAYKLYLQGNYHLYQYDEPNLRRAIVFFEQALALDPDYARAWAGIAKSWGMLADEYVRPLEAYPQARRAAEKALALDSTSADVHIALAGVAMWHDWNRDRAQFHVQKAAALEPNSAEPLTYFPWYVQDTIVSDAAIRKAYRLDPLNPWVLEHYIPLVAHQSQFDVAMQLADELLARDPARGRSHMIKGSVLHSAGKKDEAYRSYRRAMALSDTLPVLARPMIMMLAADRRVDELRHLRDRLAAKYRDTYRREDVIATLSVLIGDYDDAFAWIDRAIDSRGSAALAVARNSVFRPLHNDPRWTAAIARIRPRSD